MTDPRPPYADSSAPMTPDNQRNEPSGFYPPPDLPVFAPSTGFPVGNLGETPEKWKLPTGEQDTSHLPADEDDDDDLYEYVRVGGKVRAVLKSSIVDEPETATQHIPATALVEVVDPHNYVHLADGQVIRVKTSDLPAPAGTNAPFGHWQIDDKVHQIIGVYPVENIVKGDK